MKITIVTGFFLPMPPVAGGATEKSWHGLALEFASRGHEVVVISRRWPGWLDDEFLDGVRHKRLPGNSHTASLARNLWRDFVWSWRVWFALPPADLTVVNCVALPVWLGWLRRRAGKLVVMTGRMPKGQYRLYPRLDLVLAVSTSVRTAILAENPSLGRITKIFGYPISWQTLATPRSVSETLTIGYVGRLHREKGLDLLAAALALLAQRSDLPPWRAILCGPADIARGGSGPEYVSVLEKILPADRCKIRAPVFDATQLAEIYREIDIFCYPSIATQGETFGVSVLEAMAAGAVPVVSQLKCFSDFVRPGENGEAFDHTAADAPARLSALLAALLLDAPRRTQLARTAQHHARTYDFPEYATRLLADFSALN